MDLDCTPVCDEIQECCLEYVDTVTTHASSTGKSFYCLLSSTIHSQCSKGTEIRQKYGLPHTDVKSQLIPIKINRRRLGSAQVLKSNTFQKQINPPNLTGMDIWPAVYLILMVFRAHNECLLYQRQRGRETWIERHGERGLPVSKVLKGQVLWPSPSESSISALTSAQGQFRTRALCPGASGLEDHKVGH